MHQGGLARPSCRQAWLNVPGGTVAVRGRIAQLCKTTVRGQFTRSTSETLIKRAKTFALITAGIALLLLSPLPVFVLLTLIFNGSLTHADVEFMLIGATGVVIVSVVAGCAAELSYPIESWRKGRKKRRGLATRAALRSRRRKAIATGVPDPAVERGHVLAASLRPGDRLQARRFAIKRIERRLRHRSLLLPVYALIGTAACVTTWRPIASLLGVGLSALLIPGMILAGGSVIAAHRKNARAQRAGDPLLLIGTILQTGSSTSAESLDVDSASSSVHKVKFRVRAAQRLCPDGSLGPAPEGCHGTVTLSSSEEANQRVWIGEHVAILVSAGGHLIGRLEDAFAVASAN
jgi:hypothetical protein